MPTKGEEIGRKEFVTRKRESGPNKVANQIDLSGWDVENKEPVIVEVFRRGEKLGSYQNNIYKSGLGVTLKKSIIDDNDIEPGELLEIILYRTNRDEFENGNVIDVVSPIRDPHMADDLDARLYSDKVAEHLGDEELLLKFHNTTNGKSAIGTSNSQYDSENTFYFPADVRKEIEAKRNDRIQIIIPEEEEKESVGEIEAKSREERIDEIYEMVKELHDAYTKAKND